MTCVQVSRISELDEVAIAHLLAESQSQGFRLVERLVQDFSTGVNRFDRAGEVLFAASLEGRVVGIGGLNQDPYCNDPKVGCFRHLYVESVWRPQGIGRLLVGQIVDEASKHYQLLTLRTNTLAGDRFYQRLGFKTVPTWVHTTHHLQLSNVEYYPTSSH